MLKEQAAKLAAAWRKRRPACSEPQGPPRAAQKQGKGPPVARMAKAFRRSKRCSRAQCKRFGPDKAREAERRCREVLMLAPEHAGRAASPRNVAYQAGRPSTPRSNLIRQGRGKLDPRNPDCHFNHGAGALRTLGRPERSHPPLDAGRQALKRRSRDCALATGGHLSAAWPFEKAETHYRRLLALRPDLAEACSNLGIALASQSKWDEAAATYRRALTLNPNLVDVYRNLGRVLTTRGDSGEASRHPARACHQRNR